MLHTPYPPAGISLLEVLIAMFILSVGLLGLAALLPVGQADVVDAGKSERSSAAGRLAMRDLRARGMLAVDNWMNHDIADDPFPPEYNGGSGYIPGAPQQRWYDLDYSVDPTQGPQLPTPLDLGNAVCIDPLFITRNALALSIQGGPTPLPPDWRGRAFPYFLDDPDNAILAAFNPTYPPPRMTRVNLRAWRYSAAQILPAVPAMTYPLAERVFMIQDDRLIDLPGDATLRSQPVYGTGRRQESAGDYSWMATIVPLPGSDTPYTALNPMYSRRRCEVSVAVFYKRNLVLPSTLANGSWPLADRVGAPPNERVVLADMLSGGIGWGGGDVRLRLPGPTAAPGTTVDRSDMPRVRPNTWIMLAGWTAEPPPVVSGSPNPNLPAAASITYAAAFMSQQVSSATGITPPTPPGPYDSRFPLTPALVMPPGGARRAVFKWYRVISASPPTWNASGPQGPEWQVDVTLAGPDWNPVVSVGGTPAVQYMDVDGTGPPSSYAILLENCIGVYTRTLEVNGTSGWQ